MITWYITILLSTGTVKWVGVLDEDAIAPELYVGVRLDDNSKYFGEMHILNFTCFSYISLF